MTERQKWTRLVWRISLLTVGLAAALIFGILVLAGGDWVPGTVIVVASVVGLAGQVPAIRKVCSSPVPGPPRHTPTG